ncbi:NAD(P)-binding protein [Bimuria novae-zelandiae CBS 107.79]|uniref:NAD(P)-binding protein n=1 Tax=Bimuria novae-zelandiae CBS 107.79 TaxID=1447943 RepID=A0A6A5VB97_9PLEO|nr:NAD(P)-binding protein [Bimuria novae-zelandiae CBS 107.79]
MVTPTMPFDINTTDTDVLTAFGANAAGKTILITGPSQGGIGSQLALSLNCAKPKTLILAGRTASKIQPVVDEIVKIDPDVNVKMVKLDLLSNASVREALAQVKRYMDEVDILINNARVMATRTFVLSEDGVESQFAVNYLGHSLLTNLLVKEGLVRARGTRWPT